MSDYASDVYQSKTVGILVTLITMVFTIPYVAIQAIGCSYIFQTISGGMLSYTVGALIFFAIRYSPSPSQQGIMSAMSADIIPSVPCFVKSKFPGRPLAKGSPGSRVRL